MSYDYFRMNKRGEYICFSYSSKKRYKIKVINYLKYNHNFNDINSYLNTLGLRLRLIGTSRRYASFEIIDIE